MAQFKVGDKVRLVRRRAPDDTQHGSRVVIIGGRPTGTIIRMLPDWPQYGDCIVALDHHQNPAPYGGYAARFYQLEPLTDPRADEFIADMKRFAYLADQERNPIKVQS